MKITSDLIVKSFTAGMAISLGGVAYLSSGSALLFPIGLLIVVLYGLYLFTGKIGYYGVGVRQIGSRTFSAGELLLMWIFNTVGAYLGGFLIRLAKPGLISTACELKNHKLNESFFTIIVLGFLCNVLIFLAVDSYRIFAASNGTILTGIFALFAFTSAFVYCGFEHCVANAFYFGLSGIGGIGDFCKQMIFLTVNMIANSLGGIVTRKALKIYWR